VLFTIAAVTGGLDAAQVAVLDLETGTRTVLVRGGSHAHYVPATPRDVSPRNGVGSLPRAERESGHLVYAAAGTLRAVPFDLRRLETRGASVPVVHDVMTTESGAVFAVMANDGTLAYTSGGVAAEPVRTLVWVDRQGREMPIAAPPFGYVQPRLSPDGTQIVVFAIGREFHWQVSTAGGTRPLWARSGRELFYVSPSGAIMRVGMERGPSSAATPTLVIKEGYYTMPGNPSRTYDIAADGQRFLMIKRVVARSEPPRRPASSSFSTGSRSCSGSCRHHHDEFSRWISG
jgi:serine/threonine-protein kinase